MIDSIIDLSVQIVIFLTIQSFISHYYISFNVCMIDLCPCRCYIRSLFIFYVTSLLNLPPITLLKCANSFDFRWCTNSFFSAQVNLFICPSTPNLALLPRMKLPAAWVPWGHQRGSLTLDRVQVHSVPFPCLYLTAMSSGGSSGLFWRSRSLGQPGNMVHLEFFLWSINLSVCVSVLVDSWSNNRILLGFPWQSSGWDSELPKQGDRFNP